MKRNLLTALILLAALLPLIFLWSADYLPFTDYPNHLAVVKVLRSYDSDPFYREYFTVHYLNPLPAPNMIFDLFAAKLFPFVDEDIAGRIFLSLYVVLSLLSVILLSRETGANSDAALLGYLPLLYGFFFQAAFMNFLFSIPLVFLALAALLRFEKKGGGHSLAALLCLSGLVYLSHIFSFLVLALIVTIRLPRAGQKKIFLGVLALCFAAVAGYLVSAGLSFRWPPSVAGYKLHIMPLYLLTYPLQYYDGKLADLCLALYGAALCWLLLFSGVKEKRFLFAAAALAFCYAVFPFSGAGGTLIDVRFLPFAGLLFLVSLGKDNRTRYVVPFSLLGIVIALKLFGSLSYYASFSREFPKMMACMEQIGERSAVLPVVSIEGSNINPYTHSWGYLVLKKDIVTPYIFAGGQRPLGWRRSLYAPSGIWGYESGRAKSPLLWERVGETYAYLLIVGRTERIERQAEEIGSKQCGTPVMTLYRLNGRNQMLPR
ncbi:MAG: hypothetical protein M0Z60_12145 [Nitrospiraceae bacterium]|nr:hypothetical protein [Nitrospiraceae bacterium]